MEEIFDYQSPTHPPSMDFQSRPKSNILKVFLLIIFLIILFLALMIIFTIVFLEKGANVEKPVVIKPGVMSNLSQNQSIEIKEESISYLLNEMGAYMLHPPPFSSELPVIEFRIDRENFTSTVKEGITSTQKIQEDNPDLMFITSKSEMIEIMNSQNVSEKFIESLRTGKSQYEIITDEKTLFLKGYVSLYERITGEEVSFTGSVVRSLFF